MRLDLALAVFLFSAGFLRAAEPAPPLVADAPIIVPNSKGAFDYLQVDAPLRRLLANHTGNNTLDVFDLDTGRLLKHVPTGKAQGVAVDDKNERYFVSVSREQLLVAINRQILEKTGELKLDGPADGLVLDSRNGSLYVCHDNATHLWVINGQTLGLTATIDIPEGPEYVIYDPDSDRVFQNIKSNDSLLVIDPASNTIKERWSTAPAKNPHGLAYSPKTHRLFSAGANGKLAVIDANTGSPITSIDIATGVDQITFDPDKKRVYCASRTGAISVVEETADGAVSRGDIKTNPGAKTIAFDPKTHAVWVAYADKEHSYIRRLAAQ